MSLEEWLIPRSDLQYQQRQNSLNMISRPLGPLTYGPKYVLTQHLNKTTMMIHFTSTCARRVYNVKAIFFMASLIGLLWGCASKPIAPQAVLGSLTEAQSESFSGDLDVKTLTSTSTLGEDLTSKLLGRSVDLSQGKNRPKLISSNPCGGLIPERQREDLRARLDSAFDSYLLGVLKSNQSSLSFPQVGFSVPVQDKPAAGSIISAHLGLSRAVSFVSDDELKHYNRCCVLTGSCGQHMISKLYEVEIDAYYVSTQAPVLQTLLKPFDFAPIKLEDPAAFGDLNRAVYQAQKETRPRDKIPQRGWSHFEYRALPEPTKVSLADAKMTVLAMPDPVPCKAKKTDKADAVEFTVTFDGTDSARELLGYKVVTSKQWVDLTLLDWTGPVTLKKNELTCYPTPDAFTSVDGRCPVKITLTAFPPTCESIDGDQDFKWEATFGVFAPRDETHTAYHTGTGKTTTRVKDQRSGRRRGRRR